MLLVIILIACKQRTASTSGENSGVPANNETAVDSSAFTSIQWLDSTYLDLGTTKEGTQVDIIYHFKNTGDKNLVIESVSPSCGCTIADKPNEPIAPGNEGTIKAKFDSDHKVGNNTKTIVVTANTKDTRQHTLTFKVVVEPKS